ncbi:Uncharacterized protein OBRU01_15525 [Operophtera brumata]|uniref:Uncharacterized protein n=1 Tax=Operophtera brumata TaxID=104452 RepID=A0A0L7L437_OPEBR|nr:Uncharacterized protein OBRU01_15525 [Operophtera brumata]
MAEERRIARLKQNTSQESTTENNLARSPTKIVDLSAEEKHSTIIDSSDEDVEINKSVTNDISKTSDIELYTDGTVVTKSPKCYVPAKKHNKYIMNHAEEYVTVDIHDRNKHDTVELDNDGLVVTKTSKNSLFTIKPNKSIIDGADDDDALVISKPVDVENHRSDIVTAKKHNKNKIDSSDDDDALVISETVTIDVEKHNHDGSKSKNVTNRKHKFNIEDNSDDDDHVVNEPITIDVENHHNDDGDDGDDHHTAKKHKSNIVDSSDSDDDTAVINESITVDVYDSEKPLTSNVDSVFDNLGKTNAGDNDVIMNKGSEYFVIQADEQNKTNSSVLNDSVGHSVNNSNVKHQKTNENSIEVPNKLAERDNDVSGTQSTDKNYEQNVLEIENFDELMDVDLSDDI